jgi:hypothetical protein
MVRVPATPLQVALSLLHMAIRAGRELDARAHRVFADVLVEVAAEEQRLLRQPGEDKAA